MLRYRKVQSKHLHNHTDYFSCSEYLRLFFFYYYYLVRNYLKL